MERKARVICSVSFLLGLSIAITGFAAEATRVKGPVNPNSSTCRFNRSPAMGLGLSAALSLLVAKLTINISTGCICCLKSPRPSGPKWRTALICFVLSWVTYVIAILLFLAGVALSGQRTERIDDNSYYRCYVLKPGVFVVATILGIASVVMGMIYFLILNSAKNEIVWGNPSVPPHGNIAMGRPQFPPPQRTDAPVFVHEDTYMRRQFT